MEVHAEDLSLDVCALFDELLASSPSTNSSAQTRAFIVNRQAGRYLCRLLDSTRFLALSPEVQLQVMLLLDAGLSAGYFSVVRLRLSCDSGYLVQKLLELLRSLAATSATTVPAVASDDQCCRSSAARGEDACDLVRLLARILGMVCFAGIEIDELKAVLRELRVPSRSTPPLLDALSVMSRSRKREVAIAGDGRAARSIFDFGGDGAGLVLPVAHWPFHQEYQIVTWVRVEPSAATGSTGSPGTSETATGKAHLVTCTTDTGAGVDYYIQVRISSEGVLATTWNATAVMLGERLDTSMICEHPCNYIATLEDLFDEGSRQT